MKLEFLCEKYYEIENYSGFLIHKCQFFVQHGTIYMLLRDARRHDFSLATFIFSMINTKKSAFLKLK